MEWGIAWVRIAWYKVFMEPLLSPREAADLLGVKVGTLAAWRYRQEGPPWLKVGGAVRYDRPVLEQWAGRNQNGYKTADAPA